MLFTCFCAWSIWHKNAVLKDVPTSVKMHSWCSVKLTKNKYFIKHNLKYYWYIYVCIISSMLEQWGGNLDFYRMHYNPHAPLKINKLINSNVFASWTGKVSIEAISNCCFIRYCLTDHIRFWTENHLHIQ